MTQQILEQDYGLTNFKDNAVEGETSIIRRQETKVETELVNQVASEIQQQIPPSDPRISNFWGNNAGAATSLQSVTGQSLIAMAKSGPSGVDPLAALHKQARKGPTSDMVSEGWSSSMNNPARK
jgi:hypothetical protein